LSSILRRRQDADLFELVSLTVSKNRGQARLTSATYPDAEVAQDAEHAEVHLTQGGFFGLRTSSLRHVGPGLTAIVVASG